MATADRPSGDQKVQPPGVEGEGLDPYPTYRDGPTTPHRATASKPTDVGLPRSRRTYALPILIGLIVFALIILLRVFWGGFNLAQSTDDAMTPGDPAATAPAAGAAAPSDKDTTGAAEVEGAEVEETPGAVDVPGGATSDPPEPAAQ